MQLHNFLGRPTEDAMDMSDIVGIANASNASTPSPEAPTPSPQAPTPSPVAPTPSPEAPTPSPESTPTPSPAPGTTEPTEPPSTVPATQEPRGNFSIVFTMVVHNISTLELAANYSESQAEMQTALQEVIVMHVDLVTSVNGASVMFPNFMAFPQRFDVRMEAFAASDREALQTELMQAKSAIRTHAEYRLNRMNLDEAAKVGYITVDEIQGIGDIEKPGEKEEDDLAAGTFMLYFMAVVLISVITCGLLVLTCGKYGNT